MELVPVWKWFLVVAMTMSHIAAENVLVMVPLPLFSHTNPFMPVFRGLADRGHQLTIVSPFPQKTPHPNITDVVVNTTVEELMKSLGGFNPRDFMGILSHLKGLSSFCGPVSESAHKLAKENIQKLPSNIHFDLVIVEPYFCQEGLVSVGKIFSAPVVAIHPSTVTPIISHLTGNHFPFSYAPNNWLPFTDRMNFWQRSYNTIVNLAGLITTHLFQYPEENEHMQATFGPLPYITDVLNDISLVLSFNHHSFGYQHPLLNNIVEVGGVGSKVAQPLPPDLAKIMKDAKDGVVYFSWGSHFKPSSMSPALLTALFKVFGRLKETVLVKWENDTIPGLPSNVILRSWFPQTAILSDLKLRLFISHGGLNSVTEAAYHGVPVIGTPLFGDHPHNLLLAQDLGLGLIAEPDDITEESFLANIREVIDNPKYKKNAMKRSELMKDRPLSAIENAIYWTEYVMRHEGAPHLRPASLHLSWYQQILLDVFAFFTLIIIISAVILYKSVNCVSNLVVRLFTKDKTKQLKNSKQQSKKNL